MGQGRENVKRFLTENLDIRDSVCEAVIEQSGIKKPATEEGQVEGEGS